MAGERTMGITSTIRPLLAAPIFALAAAFSACGDEPEEELPNGIAGSPSPSASASANPPSPSASSAPGTPTAQPTTPTAQPTTPTATSGPSVTPRSVITYVNPTYGYSFEYPADWTLWPPNESGVNGEILHSYDPPVGDGRPVPPDKLKVFFWVAEGVNEPIEEWLGEVGDSEDALISLVSQSPVALDGITGVERVTENEHAGYTWRSVGYYIPIGDGRVFAINAQPMDSEPWPLFEIVLESISLTP